MAGRDLRKQEHELDAVLQQKGKQGDVFDKLGNDGVLQKIDEVKKQGGQDKGPPSLLDLAAEEAEKKKVETVKPPEEAAKEAMAPEAEKKEEEVVAQKLAEDEAKKKEETAPAAKEAAPAAAAQAVTDEQTTGKKPPKIDEAAKKLEQEKQAEEEAKKKAEDPLKAAAEQKKAAGMRAREKVTALIQQLTSNPVELQVIATATDPAQQATQLVEYVAQYLGDRDLGALAAAGHEDLAQITLVTPDARQQLAVMSPQVMKMGAFAPMLTQLVMDELARQPAVTAAGQAEGPEGEQAAPQDPRRIAPVLHRVSMRMRNPV